MGAFATMNPLAAGEITGSGTQNYLTMWTSASTVGDSIAWQDTNKFYISAANTFALNTNTIGVSIGYDSQSIVIAGVTYPSGHSSYINTGSNINQQMVSASNTVGVGSVQVGARSRGTYTVPLVVQDSDSLFSFYSAGYDGTDYAIATSIVHEIDNTVANNQIPGRIIFSTANSSGTLTERFRIDSSGNSIFSSTITGGTAVGSSLTYKSTTAAGTTTGAAHTFTGGTNGGTTIATLYNNGNINLGNYASPNNLRLVTIGQNTAFMSFGSWTFNTAFAALYMDVTPSDTNYVLVSDGTNVTLNTNNALNFSVGSASRMTINNNGLLATGWAAQSSGAITTFQFTKPNNTGQTASTAINGVLWTLGSRQWATGAIAGNQDEFLLTQPTYSFVGASTATQTATLSIAGAPAAGTNATLTTSIGLLVKAGAVAPTGTVTTSYGAYIYSQTGASVNWSLGTDGSITVGAVAVNTATALNNSGNALQLGASSGWTSSRIMTNGSTRMETFGLTATGATNAFVYSPASNTSQTASTEISGYLYNSYTRTWAAGNITTQREQYIKTVTYAFASASTITNAYGLYVEAPTAGTNATITNNYAAGFSGNLWTDGTLFNFTSASGVVIGTTGGVNFSIKANNTVRGIFYSTTSGFTIGSTGYSTFADLAITGTSKSVSAWTTSGIGIAMGGMSYTDTSSTGTVATAYTNYIRGGTILASNATTYTNYYGSYFTAATASTNVTITNNWALGTNGAVTFENVGTNGIKFQGLVGTTTTSAIYLNQTTPSATNFAIASNGSGLQLNVASNTSNIQIASAGTSWFTLSPSNQQNTMYFQPPAGSGTNQTASTEKQNVYFGTFTRTWDAGTLTTQRFIHFATQTAAFASASTITNAYGAYFEAPTAGTNATITNNWALGVSGNMAISSKVYIGSLTTAPTALFHLAAGTASANTSPLKFTSGTILTSAEAGAMEYNGNNFYITEASTQRKAITGCIYTQTSSVTVTNTVVQTSLLQSTTTLPANFFVTGKQLLIRLRGVHSASGSPTIRIRVKLGSTVILDTGVVNSVNSTNDYFDIDGVITCRTTGAAGTVFAQGFYTEAGGGGNTFQMVNTAATTIDTTTTQVYDITVEWGTASASNTLTATNGYICILN